jgi:hypothetical protein
MKDTTLGAAATVSLGGIRIRARETYVHCDLIGAVRRTVPKRASSSKRKRTRVVFRTPFRGTGMPNHYLSEHTQRAQQPPSVAIHPLSPSHIKSHVPTRLGKSLVAAETGTL